MGTNTLRIDGMDVAYDLFEDDYMKPMHHGLHLYASVAALGLFRDSSLRLLSNKGRDVSIYLRGELTPDLLTLGKKAGGRRIPVKCLRLRSLSEEDRGWDFFVDPPAESEPHIVTIHCGISFWEIAQELIEAAKSARYECMLGPSFNGKYKHSKRAEPRTHLGLYWWGLQGQTQKGRHQ